MKRTLLISGAVMVGWVGTLMFVGDPARWPAVEIPPRQGEAAELPSPGSPARHAPAALARLVREPQNTWSNFAFVGGGALLISFAATRMARGVGVALIAVGVGSFLYHASAAEALRHLDVGAMFWLYLTTMALCVAALAPRWRRRIEGHAGALFILTLLCAVGLTAARTTTAVDVQPLFLRFGTALAAAVVILTLAEIARRLETLGAALQLLGVVTLFGIAAACQVGDRPGGRLFRPAALIQAHAVWHVLAAMTLVWSVRLLDRAASLTLPVVSGADNPESPTK